ncbi:hypothetical protein INR49_003760 [Caranx melampygus]|nr:hypothetical protein INR49_003760 [Caranx melampygus]
MPRRDWWHFPASHIRLDKGAHWLKRSSTSTSLSTSHNWLRKVYICLHTSMTLFQMSIISSSKKGRAGLKHFANKHSCRETGTDEELDLGEERLKVRDVWHGELHKSGTKKRVSKNQSTQQQHGINNSVRTETGGHTAATEVKLSRDQMSRTDCNEIYEPTIGFLKRGLTKRGDE